MPAARLEFAELRDAFPNVFLYGQPNSYFDTRTFATFFDDFLAALPPVPHVVVLDNASGHFSSHVRAASALRSVKLVSTPPDCTDICAATDAGLGRSVKLIIKNKFRDHFRTHIDQWRHGKFSARDRRRLIVQWFSEAVNEFGSVGQKQIISAHQRCGTGLRFNGGENNLVKIEGYSGAIEF